MNMKIITNNFTSKQTGVLLSICAVLFAALLFATPAQVRADDEDFYYGGYDYSYDSGDDFYYGGYDYSYDNNDDFYYGGYDYSYDTPTYSSYTSDYVYTPSSSYVSDYVYTPSYSSCSSCGGSYYTPSYSTPRYVSSASSYSTPTYVYNSAKASSNASANANSSSNSSVGNITNNNNNVNNNTVVVNTPAPTTPTTPVPPTVPTLDGYCTINPNYVNINQDVTFSATVTGGNGGYTYYWNGSDGIYSSSQSFTGRFGSTGTKTATVTITSGNQSITRSCSVNVQNQYNNNLSAYCVASPSVSNIGQTVTWTAYVNGYNNYYGNYSYSWNGTDGLYGNGQSVYTTYNSYGTKTANVTVYANGQTITASCSTNVQGGYNAGVTVIRTPDQGTPVSGIYLSQIPATGIDFNMKTILFTLGLVIWSAFMAYIVISRRKVSLAGNSSSISKAEAFKIANMKKQGLVA